MTFNFETKVFTNKFKNVRLDSLLVDMQLVSSRQKAVSLIMRGDVFSTSTKRVSVFVFQNVCTVPLSFHRWSSDRP